MVFRTLKGRTQKVKSAYKYKVDWDGDSLSKVQKRVKDLLFPHWGSDYVYEEFPMAGTRLRFDFYNATRKIVIEVDGKQHFQFNRHFHNNSLSNFLRQIDKDNSKEDFCELNGIKLYRIREDLDLEEQLKEIEI